jgi:hypothetical protein
VCDGLKTRRDVDAVAINASVVKDDITLVDANAKLQATRRVVGGVALSHRPLNCEGSLHGIHGTLKLSQDAIARRVDHPSSMFADQREHDSLMPLEIANSRFLVRTHDGAVAGNVGGEYGSKLSSFDHGA